jgi:tetratricopeptide (TPR) repeat protein
MSISSTVWSREPCNVRAASVDCCVGGDNAFSSEEQGMLSSRVGWVTAGILLLVWPPSQVSAIPMPLETNVPSVSVTPSEQRLQKGMADLRSNDLQAAETAFEDTLKSDPKRVEALIGLAEIALKRGKTEETQRYLKQANSVAPKHLAVHLAWAKFFLSQKKWHDVEVELKKSIEIDPKALVPRLALADFYLANLHKPKRAIVAYREALILDPQSVAAHYSLGVALVDDGQQNEAVLEWQEAGRLAPANPLPFQTVGRFYSLRKEPAKAIEFFSLAIKAQPDHAPAHMDRADIYFATGEQDKALQDYQAALAIAPKSAGVYVKMGMIYERRQQWSAAEQALKTAVALNDKQALAYNNLAWLAAEGHIAQDSALTWANRAVSLAPQVLEFQDTLAWVLRARGKLEQAASVLEKVSAKKPDESMYLYHLGVVYADMGNRNNASDAFEKALTLKGNFPAADDARRRLEVLRHGISTAH